MELAGAIQALRGRHGYSNPQPHLLIIDSFEYLAPLEGWLQDEFLPAQTPGFRLILAGRSNPH
jgi:hypothetical protein